VVLAQAAVQVLAVPLAAQVPVPVVQQRVLVQQVQVPLPQVLPLLLVPQQQWVWWLLVWLLLPWSLQQWPRKMKQQPQQLLQLQPQLQLQPDNFHNLINAPIGAFFFILKTQLGISNVALPGQIKVLFFFFLPSFSNCCVCSNALFWLFGVFRRWVEAIHR
jgi:hypothetical protein